MGRPGRPLEHIAVLRTAIYLFVLLDIAQISNGAFAHGDTPEQLSPLKIRSVLPPARAVPHAYVRVLARGGSWPARWSKHRRLPRLAGWVCCAGMLDWLSNNFSYGKIDHDHTALIIALLVLPTVGRARWRDTEGLSELRPLGVALHPGRGRRDVFLFGGGEDPVRRWGWPNSAILTWAFVRRGTGLADQLLRWPWAVVASQWALILLETASPVLLFLRGRALYLLIAVFAFFHLTTWLLLRIHFLPLVICLLAFLPVERVVPVVARPPERSAPLSQARLTPPAGFRRPRSPSGWFCRQVRLRRPDLTSVTISRTGSPRSSAGRR